MTGTPTPISVNTLRALLRRDYDIGSVEMIYRPADWSVGGYTITDANGERYFLKVQRTTPSGFAAGSRDFYLPLTRELRRCGILPDIAYPIPTVDGRLSVAHDPFVLVLNNYIDGSVLGDEGITDCVLIELGTLLGILHHSITQIRFDHPLAETFQVAFRGEFERAFATLEHTGPDKAPGVAGLRAAVLPRRDEIEDYLRILIALQTAMRSRSPSMVVCHTDVHAWNLMRGSAGQLYLIDWDNAMIAPAEHDLFFFAGDERFWRMFLPAYEHAASPASIRPDVLRFYYYRRGLEDMADYLRRILRGDGDTARDKSDLEGIEDCLGDLGRIEGTIGRIKERLASR